MPAQTKALGNTLAVYSARSSRLQFALHHQAGLLQIPELLNYNFMTPSSSEATAADRFSVGCFAQPGYSETPNGSADHASRARVAVPVACSVERTGSFFLLKE